MPDPAGALILRPAGPGDLPAMAALLNAVIAEGDKTAFEGVMTPADMDRLFVSGPDARGCTLALEGDRLLGFQALNIEYLRGTRWADISSFVSAGARGRGVGRVLWRATCDVARGIHGFRAVIRSVNPGALGYYGACGFVPDPGGLPDAVAIALPGRRVLYSPRH